MENKETGTFRVKAGLAEMLKGGVIMDVTTPEQAKIAEDAGAAAVMALERVPADIRKEGGVARMAQISVIEAIQHAPVIDHLLGARHGVRGIIEEKFIDLKKVPFQTLEAVAETPAAALGSTRDKPDKAYCEKIFEVFARNNIRYFFYIGGNDSADTSLKISRMRWRCTIMPVSATMSARAQRSKSIASTFSSISVMR